jgi:hypothetical protein
MKKLILLLAMVAISHSIVFSQIWAPDGAEWYNYYTETGCGGPIAEGYYYMHVEGDTIVNGITCRNISRHIMHSDGEYETLAIPIITYMEDDKVYYLQNNQFYLLYDFAAEVGDSWTSRNPWEYFNWIPPEPGEDTLSTYTVDTIRFVKIDGTILRQIYVSSSSVWYFGGYISERIGCLGFMLPGIWGIWDPPVAGIVRCYHDYEINYSTLTPCDTLINGIDDECFLNEKIRLFPNPATFIITINVSGGQSIEKTVFYNHLGQKVLVAVPVNNTVDVSKLTPGIYFIEVATKDRRGRTKLIIE